MKGKNRKNRKEANKMLSSDLLITRISKGTIRPAYAKFDPETLDLAKLLIDTFKLHVGKPYGELLAELEGFEEMNFRFIRGLSQLLIRRSVVETVSVVDPSSAREAVFEACGGMAPTPEERKAALETASEKFSVSVPELEEALWADLEENQVLKEFRPQAPAELLRQYNISQTQTLLFRAVDMDLWIRGNYQQLLWAVVRAGLMYSLGEAGETNRKIEEEVRLHLDGPASLFRMSERYGNAFARVFPVLLKCESWGLRAGILHKGYQGKRILEFTLDDSEEAFGLGLGPGPLHKPGLVEEGKESYGPEESAETETKTQTRKEAYDSVVEKEFASLGFGRWKARREPTVLKAGPYAFVPDFSLERDGVLVFVEIVGFWTPEYLEKKIRKLKEVKETVLLLVGKKLRCSEKDFPGRNVIFYDKKIPAREIMQALREYEEKKFAEDLEKLRGMEIELSGELIGLEGLAEEKGVWTEALKALLSEKLAGSEDYVLLEDFVLQRGLLEKLDRRLEKLNSYAGAVGLFEEFGLDPGLYYPVLECLGYKVVWCGLSEEDARIKKGN